jgi:hypothetical protein
MSSVPFPGHGGEQPRCPVCHDAGYLPSVIPSQPYLYELCPCCHQDHRWTVADDGDSDPVDLASLSTYYGTPRN